MATSTYTRNSVRDIVKEIVGRSYTGIDDTIYENINASIELFGGSISAIYDEETWRHTFDSSDTSNNTDNYALPDNIKYILAAYTIDPDGTEDVYHPLEKQSPIMASQADRVSGRSRPGFNTASRTYTEGQITWRDGKERSSSAVQRVDREGVPEIYWRWGDNIYIYPRNSSSEEGWHLDVMLAMKPAFLTSDTSNSITLNYPYALAHFASGLLWSTRFGDTQRAVNHFQIGGQLLSSIASEQEISKLINIAAVRRA